MLRWHGYRFPDRDTRHEHAAARAGFHRIARAALQAIDVRLRALVVAAFALVGLCGALLAAPALSELTGRVVDQANVLDSAAEGRLTSKLADLENKTSTQLVVVTLSSLQGYDIADFGYQLGRHWGIGQKGKNNGALLIVAPNERKVRIEVGYGLEGQLTDAVSRLIIDNAILPRFRAADFTGGIERGTDDIIQVLSGDAADFKKRAAERDSRPSGQEGMAWTVVVFLFLAFWVFGMVRAWTKEMSQRRRRGWFGPASTAGWGSGSSSSSGWSSGGSWSSGDSGGGGFSGGGGDFGGGGSSGSW
jgi:uncharacterized protein